MHKALNETLAALPDETRVFVSPESVPHHTKAAQLTDEQKPGHEYTKSNVKFCMSVLQSEAVKALSAFAEKNQETQGKFTIGDEKKHNVFMRPQVSDSIARWKDGRHWLIQGHRTPRSRRRRVRLIRWLS